MTGLAAAGLGWFLVAQAVAPTSSWDDLLKQMVAQAFPVLLGFLVHWLGVRTRPAGGNAPPDATTTP